MTREELEKVLEEIEARKDLIKKELDNISAGGGTESGVEEELRGRSPSAALKKALRRAIKNGDLENALEKVSNSLDLTKSAVETMAQIVEKARAKISGEVENADGINQMAAMANTWLPMFLGLMKTPEFQNLSASMLVNMLKEEAS
ncbi:hypothetical protein [Thermosediminibacter litoriperuensis]|uniref:DUF1641 domain-containing protein n=1 Tax=Thermosediminibacter litoriperuensis TaxID=291989 RepID=A0A5S5ALX8_9FIRM|nr:hypothetical protein [Thermosediminibacter litoriperuensis]TYP52427.1 hypothetical protein LZ11_01771 [Thermosediminibacter litoriperuensis]